MAEARTFYCVMEGKPSNQVIPFGGGRRLDGSGKVIYEPYKEIRFSDGKFQTSDLEFIAWLEAAAKTPATGVVEDYEEYLRRILPPEKNAERLAQRVVSMREENNRLLEQLRSAKKEKATA